MSHIYQFVDQHIYFNHKQYTEFCQNLFKGLQRMTQNICECHCGTRIDLDQELLEQREMWKEKYLCLQKQFKIDIQTLKQNIYAECAGIMQQQFSQKEQQNNKIINQKNVEIKDLIARVINLQTQVKVLGKEKELFEQRVRELEAEIGERDETINSLKSKSSKGIRDWQLKHEEEIANVKQRLTAQAKQNVDKIEAEREVLKQKLKQFETKYQKILPQIEKMKNCLTTKTTQNEQLIKTIQKLTKKMQEDQLLGKTKYEDLQKIHSTCSKQIKILSDKNEDLSRQMDKCRKLSRDVRVQPVYIDRPVEVEKVVEKIVQVEKLVNKYVDNPGNQKKLRMLEDENKKLKDELNNVLKEIKEIEEHYKQTVIDFEDNIKEHEKNALLYKKERESLALRIGEQNKELELLHNFVEKLGGQNASRSQQTDNEKIVVHVKQDGTYQKTVEKLPAVPATSNQRKKK